MESTMKKLRWTNVVDGRGWENEGLKERKVGLKHCPTFFFTHANLVASGLERFDKEKLPVARCVEENYLCD